MNDETAPAVRAQAPPHSPLGQSVLDTVDVGIVACDADGHLTLFNRAARRLHVIDAAPAVPPAEWASAFDLYGADGVTPLDADRVPLWRALVEGEVVGAEIVVAPHGLPARRVRCDGRALLDAAGGVVGAVVALTDVTAAHLAERELRRAHDALHRSTVALSRSEAQFRAAFEDGPVATCWIDHRGTVTRANPALRRLLVLASRSLHGVPLVGLVVPADRERLEVCVRAAAARVAARPVAARPVAALPVTVEPVEVRAQRPDGTHVWCELTVTRCADDQLLVQLADVDARKQRELELELVAARDSLTGLVNRSGLQAVLSERLADREGARTVTLLFLDLDDFKRVNDTLGHEAGDAVLVEVARRIRSVVRPTDTVARLGGDEFVVVCGDTRTTEASLSDAGRHADALVRRLHQALAPPVHLPTGRYQAKASIGVALAGSGEHPTSVLARADSAMYESKGRPRFVPSGRVTTGSVTAGGGVAGGVRDQPRLTDLVATAVQEDRLSVVYQPVVDLGTGLTIGVEALVRMTDRRGHLVMPDAFIPVAESDGAIHDIGDWVLRTGCRQAARWKQELAPGSAFSIGINLSPRQLDDPALLPRVGAALTESGLDPAALVLELTERLLTADSAHNREAFAALRELGVHLAADDFGTGYSSVAYLADLPLDIIKLDRSWTSRLGRVGCADGPSSPASRLAVGVARLAEATGLVVVAEGIETAEEAAAVQRYGCGLGQGYLYSRPVSADELGARLRGQGDALVIPGPRGS